MEQTHQHAFSCMLAQQLPAALLIAINTAGAHGEALQSGQSCVDSEEEQVI